MQAPNISRLPLSVAWIAIVVTLLLAGGNAIYVGGTLSAQVDQNSADLEKTDSMIVPRLELDAKLQGIQTQIRAVQTQMTDLKRQGEQNTSQILRRLERMNMPGRSQ